MRDTKPSDHTRPPAERRSCGGCLLWAAPAVVYLALFGAVIGTLERSGDVLGAISALLSMTMIMFFGLWAARIFSQDRSQRFSLRTLLLGQLFLAGSMGTMIVFFSGRRLGPPQLAAMVALGLALVWSVSRDLREFRDREKAARRKKADE